ncbi:MAG: hypothetical protein CVU92_06110 [Firmicutes bacterium HGW-Firmicutes-17]|jgi:uncharacterized protein YbaR (Trm112 family)|nr:MAG: hypothetical protein CVU92_06110 [Firmicutes bacterium HGW-Firmicutes-17]
MARIPAYKELINTRLANTYGGWIYCEGCNKTIGYLCYVTYDLFRFDYRCKCGNCGSVHLVFERQSTEQTSSEQSLITIKNRLCCPEDKSPLATILVKNLDSYKYEISCKACNTKYQVE